MTTGMKIDKDLEVQVVNYYLSQPMSLKECGNYFNLCSPTISKILDRYNIGRYKKSLIFNKNLNENYFETIDTEYKAYFLGLIITDGNVFIESDRTNNRQASISITLQESDAYILNLFLADIGASTSIGHDGRGCCTCAIRSDKVAKDLSKYGVKPRKTLDACLPILDDNMMPHMIRGLIDGDGSIFVKRLKNNRAKHSISLCGTHQLVNSFGDYLSRTLHVFKPKVYDYKDKHLSEIRWSNYKDFEIICDWLYSDATIYLERKRNSFLNFYTLL